MSLFKDITEAVTPCTRHEMVAIGPVTADGCRQKCAICGFTISVGPDMWDMKHADISAYSHSKPTAEDK